jgi:dTDP-4-amino-4,6-dideoxygalactose transaminase
MDSMQLTFPDFDDSELVLLRRCLDSRWVTQGPLTREFEELMAKRHGLSHALATTSCTAALHLAVLALGLGPGDEVVVPAFTWVTSAHCAEYVGARAVFADVDPATHNLDPKTFEAAITPRTKAVVAVHLFGLAAEMDAILATARRNGLAVIEDAACGIGSSYQGRPVGGLGDVGCFSFHPRKIVTTGEGGMVTTDREDLAARVRSFRNHGASPPGPAQGPPGRPYTMAAFDRLGFNLRMSDIQAAVGVAQMAKLDRLLAHRRARAAFYSHLLSSIEEFALPPSPEQSPGHTYQSYVIRLHSGDRLRRNRIMEHLADQGIETRPGTHAVHRLGYYAQKYQLKPEQFPNAVRSEDATITLPLFPGMREADQERVATALRNGLAASRR